MKGFEIHVKKSHEISEEGHHYTTKQDMHCLIIFNVVTTLPSSTSIFNFLIISVRRYARRYARILLLSLLFYFFISLLTLDSNM